MSEYATKSIGKNIAQVQDFIIAEEPMARLVFRAQIHSGGVRGRLIRQRRVSKDDVWNDDTPVDIRTLEKGESINIELKTETVSKLHSIISELNTHIDTNGIDYGFNSYKTVKSDSIVINSGNISDVIKKIIHGHHSQDVLRAFSENEEIDLTTFTDAERVKTRRKIVQEFQSRLAPGAAYSETKGNDAWQKFVLNNHWMFGANYLEPIDRAKINIRGSMPDFLYPTADGFADVLDIKLPTNDVIVEDNSHAGAWKWSADTNTALGQVTNYIVDIERLRLEIEKDIKANINRDVLLIKPRAYILTGNSERWLPAKKEALRKLNSMLHSIEVITYYDLFLRAKRAIEE
jgi:hypothetical protein